MKPVRSTLIIAALFASTSAFADDKIHSEVDVSKKADGTYKADATTTRTDANGTTSSEKRSESAKTTWSGKDQVTTKQESSEDPKGLGNKTTEKTEITSTEDKGGNTKRSAMARSVDSAGTTHETKGETAVTNQADGSKKIEVEEKRVNDPKGLMNKTVTESESTIVKHPDGTSSEKKTVNGTVVKDR